MAIIEIILGIAGLLIFVLLIILGPEHPFTQRWFLPLAIVCCVAPVFQGKWLFIPISLLWYGAIYYFVVRRN